MLVFRGLAEAAALLLITAFLLFELVTGFGVVHEHCLDAVPSRALGRPDIESHWTSVLWPPLAFSARDPAGMCVRTSPLHEALTAIGIARLPSPQAQVRRHVLAQPGLRRGLRLIIHSHR